MKKIEWDHEKNKHLKESMNFDFDDVLHAIVNDQLQDVLTSSVPGKYLDHKLLKIKSDNKIYFVLAKEVDQKIILTTIIKNPK